MASTPSISGRRVVASPYLSPHLAMVRRTSPISFVPLSTKDYRKKPRKRKKKKKQDETIDEAGAGAGAGTTKDKQIIKIKKKKKREIYFDASHPDKLTTRQWMIYIQYCWGFFALGIFTSAPGPILPTLMTQVDVSLATISYIFSARAVGFVLGSMISGYVMDRYQKYLTSYENQTKFLLKRHEKIADYLWSLPKWNWWPMSAHNVFTISIIIAAITNAAIPYVSSVISLSIIVSINGICFGNINTFGNVLLLTLFDIDVSHDIDFDIVYRDMNALAKGTALDITEDDDIDNIMNKSESDDEDHDNDNDDDDNQDENDYNYNETDELIEESVSSYGSLPKRDDIGETTIARMNKQDERVGPFMQFLQAIYALGGFLAPIFIQISFEISGGYAYAFWFFTLLYIPPGIILLFYPEPVRMSVISDRLKQIERINRSAISLASMDGTTDGELEIDPIEQRIAELKAKNKKFWSNLLCLGFAIFLLWYVGAQVGYGMYITTYAITYLNTSAAIGRYLASANWAGLFIGRFVAVPLSSKMSALNMVRVDLAGMTIGCFILFFSNDWQYIVWISSVMVGFFMASVWPSMFVWAEKLIPVTGIFASIMVGGGSMGEFIIPALQGNIMAAMGSQYFNHVMFAMSVFLVINLVINHIIAKRLTNFL